MIFAEWFFTLLAIVMGLTGWWRQRRLEQLRAEDPGLQLQQADREWEAARNEELRQHNLELLAFDKTLRLELGLTFLPWEKPWWEEAKEQRIQGAFNQLLHPGLSAMLNQQRQLTEAEFLAQQMKLQNSDALFAHRQMTNAQKELSRLQNQQIGQAFGAMDDIFRQLFGGK